MASGALTETVLRPTGPGHLTAHHPHRPSRGPPAFGPRYVHDLANDGQDDAVSVHVYGPKLTTMSYYGLDGRGRYRRRPHRGRAGHRALRRHQRPRPFVSPFGRRSGGRGPPADHPHPTLRSWRQPRRRAALVVDIRPAAQRAVEGDLPGALVIERNVLEWRLDPFGPDRIPQVTGFDRPVVVVCSEGYASSLAADSLRAMGYRARHRPGRRLPGLGQLDAVRSPPSPPDGARFLTNVRPERRGARPADAGHRAENAATT